jgi:hypothetical protein
MNPYVFIVGCPRSGTTLLERVVNAHPQIAVMPEAHWILRKPKSGTRANKRGLTGEGPVTAEEIRQLSDDRKFAALGIGPEELAALAGEGAPVPYGSFVRGIFDWYGKAQGKALVGNKTPAFVRRLHRIHSLWPEVRIVHLIRDGRDVYLSVRNRPLKSPARSAFAHWAEEPAVSGALWWESSVRRGREAGKSLGPQLYYEMRYESLIARPAEECQALCAFLGLPYDEAMLRFNEGQTKPKRARPITPGMRDWRTQMPAEEVERFEAAAGALLDELGYARAFPRPGPESVERASRLRGLLAGVSGSNEDSRARARA